MSTVAALPSQPPTVANTQQSNITTTTNDDENITQRTTVSSITEPTPKRKHTGLPIAGPSKHMKMSTVMEGKIGLIHTENTDAQLSLVADTVAPKQEKNTRAPTGGPANRRTTRTMAKLVSEQNTHPSSTPNTVLLPQSTPQPLILEETNTFKTIK